MNRIRLWMKGKMFRYIPGMISCQEFEGFIADYIDNELNSKQRRVFELHLKLCRECRDYIGAYKKTRAVGKAVLNSKDGTIPADVPEDLVKAVLDSRDK